MDIRLLKRFRQQAKKNVFIYQCSYYKYHVLAYDGFKDYEIGIKRTIHWTGESWEPSSSKKLATAYSLGLIKDGYEKACREYIIKLAEHERARREIRKGIELLEKAIGNSEVRIEYL